MTWTEFGIIAISVIITMLICRVVPMFLLKGKELPEKVSRALNLIPAATFAALIANDLFSVGMFSNGLWEGMMPLIAAVLVCIAGYIKKSLVLCIVVGVASYAIMMFI